MFEEGKEMVVVMHHNIFVRCLEIVSDPCAAMNNLLCTRREPAQTDSDGRVQELIDLRRVLENSINTSPFVLSSTGGTGTVCDD